MKGFYINLHHRIDRLILMTKIKRKYPFFNQVKRFKAIYHKNGRLGCALSHCLSLQRIKKEYPNEKYYLIMEDDIIIFQNHFNQFKNTFAKIENSDEWDVILLTTRGHKVKGAKSMEEYGFHKYVNSLTATGYIVKNKMVDVLIKNFKECIKMLAKGNRDTALDVHWHHLQHSHNFYYYHKKFASQMPGYSDIENNYVNYIKSYNF